MRRKYVSDQDLDTIIRLRKSGASWLKIESITQIPRRTSKRIFEDWQKTRTAEELKSARQQIAAAAFNYHMQDLINIARVILDNMGDPSLKDKRDGTSVLNCIFETDIRGRGQEETYPPTATPSTARIIRQNKLLFNSLKEHTIESVDFFTFDKWLAARNTWKTSMDKLYSEVAQVIRNIINQKYDTRDVVTKINSDEALVDKMVTGAVETMYRAILDGKVTQIEQIKDYINMKQLPGGITILFSGNITTTDLVVESKELAEEILKICKSAVDILFRGKGLETVEVLADALHIMRDSRNELDDSLDELRLTPIILHTKCELCPA